MSSNIVTYDRTPPIRPGIDDLGGGNKQNATRPPDPVRSLTAEDWNQASKQIVEFAAVLPVAIITMRFTSGTPAILALTGMGSAAKNPATYTITDVGVGNTRITWPTGTFPGRVAHHVAHIIGSTPGMISANTISDGVEVITLDASGSAADRDFVVYIYGQ